MASSETCFVNKSNVNGNSRAKDRSVWTEVVL